MTIQEKEKFCFDLAQQFMDARNPKRWDGEGHGPLSTEVWIAPDFLKDYWLKLAFGFDASVDRYWHYVELWTKKDDKQWYPIKGQPNATAAISWNIMYLLETNNLFDEL